MADRRRNHFIPRFLLARFASKRDGKKSWVWQVSREGEPQEISTRDAAVATDFYGGRETGIEDAFAEAEGHFARALLSIEGGAPIREHEDTVKQLIWTLAVRTRALRQQFAALAHGLADTLIETSRSSQDMMAQYMRSEFLSLMEKEFSTLPPEEQTAASAAISAPEAREEILEAIEGLMRSPLPQLFFDQFRDILQDQGMQRVAEGGQVKGLGRLLGDKKAPDSFSPSYWHLHRVDPHPLILGDSCAFAVRTDGRLGSLLPGNRNVKWETIYLPISPHTALVAARRKPTYLLGPEEINRASAGLSWSHIYSSVLNDAVRTMAAAIGSIAPILSEEEILDLASNSWKS